MLSLSSLSLSSLVSLGEVPTSLDLAARFAITLIAGIVLGELSQRVLRFPRLTGYLVGGLIVGPSGFNLIAPSGLPIVNAFVDIVLGLLVFELGSRVDLSWLRRNRWLTATIAVEAGATFAAVFALLRIVRIEPHAAAIVAAIAVTSSPSVIVRIVIELRARGPITERLLLHAAFNSTISIVLVSAIVAMIRVAGGQPLVDIVVEPLYLVCGSVLLGAACGWSLAAAFRLFSQREGDGFVLALAVLLLGSTAAHVLHLSAPLALLMGGLLLRNRSKRLVLLPPHFGTAGGVLVVLLFVFNGVQLDIKAMTAGGLIVLALVVVRAGVKIASIVGFAPPTGLAWRKAAWLGVAMLPMSGLALVIVNDPVVRSLEAGRIAAPIVYAAVFIMELAAPILAAVALRSVHEDQAVRIGGRRHA